MRETALAYVRHGGNAVAMAAELHVHPQTARYRIARLRELLGDQLDDPDARFELRAGAACCPARSPRTARRRPSGAASRGDPASSARRPA